MKHICVKIVDANPMTRGAYNAFRGWPIPSDENPEEDGYLVRSPDGYVTWSPKGQFEEVSRPIKGMTFGHAVEAARKGCKIARSGWNGKNQFVVMMPALYLPAYNTQEPGAKVNDRTAKHIGKDTPLDSQPYFALFNAQGKWQPGWVPSTSDCLAEDWNLAD